MNPETIVATCLFCKKIGELWLIEEIGDYLCGDCEAKMINDIQEAWEEDNPCSCYEEHRANCFRGGCKGYLT